MHALQMCIEADVEVLVAARPGNAKSGGGGPLAGGVDPDSLVAGGGAEQLKEAIDRAQGGIEFFCFEVWGKARANADARTRALEDAARLIGKIDNPTKRDLVLDTFGKALDIDVGVVRAAVARATADRNARGQGHQGQGQGHGQAYDRGGDRGGGRPGHPNAPHPGSPDGRGETAENRDQTPVRTLDPEVEVISLLADHPSLLTTPDADRVSSLLTEPRLQAMYSAARAGQSFLELASMLLPPPTAQHVLSGKYAEHKNPGAQLAAFLDRLEQRSTMVSQKGLEKSLVAAQRGGADKDVVRLQVQLAVAQRKGDRELVEQLKEQIRLLLEPSSN
jgi:hypothetical protein